MHTVLSALEHRLKFGLYLKKTLEKSLKSETKTNEKSLKLMLQPVLHPICPYRSFVQIPEIQPIRAYTTIAPLSATGHFHINVLYSFICIIIRISCSSVGRALRYTTICDHGFDPRECTRLYNVL